MNVNGTQTTPEHTEIPNEADWALPGIPDSINATGLLADDLEEYGGTYSLVVLVSFLSLGPSARFILTVHKKKKKSRRRKLYRLYTYSELANSTVNGSLHVH